MGIKNKNALLDAFVRIFTAFVKNIVVSYRNAEVVPIRLSWESWLFTATKGVNLK